MVLPRCPRACAESSAFIDHDSDYLKRDRGRERELNALKMAKQVLIESIVIVVL